MPGAALALSTEAIDHLREIMRDLAEGDAFCNVHIGGECELCAEITEAVA